MNAATSDSWWVVAAFAAKCGDAPLAVAAILFAALFAATSLLFWSAPGGPAWGRRRIAHASIRNFAIPGPHGLPWVGSMALMTGLAHRRIADAAARFKAERLMAFSLGETPVVVTCHADVAREILHSPAFADRPVKDSAYRLLFHRAIGFAPYGAYWRALRRVAAGNMFCPRQVSTSSPLRADIAAQMVAELGKWAGSGSAVRVRDVLKRASLHNMMASVFGRKYGLGSVCPEVEKLWAMVDEGYDLLGKLNWADHLPVLAGLDPQKIRLRCSKLVPKVNQFVGDIVRDHRAGSGPEAADFVDVLLSLEGADKLSESDMIAVLWVSIKPTDIFDNLL